MPPNNGPPFARRTVNATAAAEAEIDLRAGLLGILNLVELGFAERPAR